MNSIDRALLSFISHHAGEDQPPPSLDAKLGWWNRGWVVLDPLGPEKWTITTQGRIALRAGGIDPDKVPLKGDRVRGI